MSLNVALFVVFSLFVVGGKAEVSVYAPVSTYWGIGGDQSLEINVEVTSTEGWDDVIVSVSRPDGSIVPVTTDDASNSATKNYTYVINYLIIDDAGVYEFTAESSVNPSESSSSVSETVTLYVFTVNLYPKESTYHVVDRDATTTMVFYVSCEGNWTNIEVNIYTPHLGVVPTTSAISSHPYVRIFSATISDLITGSYNVTAVETLDSKTYSQTVVAKLEIHNSSYVDEYLYRMGVATDDFVSLIPDWHSYWYDGPDNTYILDGGNDMYDRGNYVSVGSSNETINNIAYGKPVISPGFEFSSKHLYPFVSLMWITNEEELDEFMISVKGQTGTFGQGSYENYNRTMFEFSYEVDYEIVQVYGTKDPSICEVYFTISNEYLWDSKKPTSQDVTVAGFPPASLNNVARISGAPKNIMFGYTLLSKTNGSQVSRFEVELVLEKITAIIAGVDEFAIVPNSEDGLFTGYKRDTIKIGVVVTTSGEWGGVVVRVVLPGGSSRLVTSYTTDGVYNRRIYESVLENIAYEDNGDYVYIAQDSYGLSKEAVTSVYVFTTSLDTEQSEYTTNTGEAVSLEILVTSDTTNWGLIVVEVETPTKGTLDVNNWSADSTNTRVYRLVIDDPTASEDDGRYVFHVTENFRGRSRSDNIDLELKVFSAEIEATEESYTTEAGAEVLELSVDVTTSGDWDDVTVTVFPPRRQSRVLEDYDVLSTTRRRYIYVIESPTTEDSGSYRFEIRENLFGELKTENVYVDVVVSEGGEELSAGEIAGIVIGSIAGAAILIAIIYCSCRKPEKVSGDTQGSEDKVESRSKAGEETTTIENEYVTKREAEVTSL